MDLNKNQFSIGVDIESISRFKGLDIKKNSLFLKRIFTKSELTYSFSKKIPAPHLAVRFAAKEAAIKALNSIGIKKIRFDQIEIVKNKGGVPSLIFKSLGKIKMDWSVSLSHSQDNAIAVVQLIKL